MSDRKRLLHRGSSSGGQGRPRGDHRGRQRQRGRACVLRARDRPGRAAGRARRPRQADPVVTPYVQPDDPVRAAGAHVRAAVAVRQELATLSGRTSRGGESFGAAGPAGRPRGPRRALTTADLDTADASARTLLSTVTLDAATRADRTEANSKVRGLRRKHLPRETSSAPSIASVLLSACAERRHVRYSRSHAGPPARSWEPVRCRSSASRCSYSWSFSQRFSPCSRARTRPRARDASRQSPPIRAPLRAQHSAEEGPPEELDRQVAPRLARERPPLARDLVPAPLVRRDRVSARSYPPPRALPRPPPRLLRRTPRVHLVRNRLVAVVAVFRPPRESVPCPDRRDRRRQARGPPAPAARQLGLGRLGVVVQLRARPSLARQRRLPRHEAEEVPDGLAQGELEVPPPIGPFPSLIGVYASWRRTRFRLRTPNPLCSSLLLVGTASVTLPGPPGSGEDCSDSSDGQLRSRTRTQQRSPSRS